MEIKSKIPEINMADNETGCCPRFHPEAWDQQIITLDDYTFMKADTKSLFYFPINMGKVFTKAMNDILLAGADVKETYLILSKDLSAFKAEHYFLVNKPVPGRENTKLSGNYYTRVFEGAYRDMPKWMSLFAKEANKKGLKIENLLAFYTTCPKCAKHYGKNYVVLFGAIKA